MRRVASAAAATLALAGCGSKPADLFSVDRSGVGPGAELSLAVSDAGTVRCNGGEPKPLEPQQLLDARELARDLGEQAALGLELPPGAAQNTTFRYRAELAQGSIAWADSSRGVPKSFVALAGFTRVVSRQVCGLER